MPYAFFKQIFLLHCFQNWNIHQIQNVFQVNILAIVHDNKNVIFNVLIQKLSIKNTRCMLKYTNVGKYMFLCVHMYLY